MTEDYLHVVQARLEQLRSAEYIPGASMRAVLKRILPSVAAIIDAVGDRFKDVPGRAAVDDILSEWVEGKLGSVEAATTLLPIMARRHTAFSLEDAPPGIACVWESLLLPVWRMVLTSASEGDRKTPEVKMRLKLLELSGYPLGSEFHALFRENTGVAFVVPSLSDAFADKLDKPKIDRILANWAAGIVDDTIALTQLSHFKLRYGYAVESQNTFEHAVATAWAVVVDQSSTNVQDTYEDLIEDADCQRTLGMSMEERNRLWQERHGRDSGQSEIEL